MKMSSMWRITLVLALAVPIVAAAHGGGERWPGGRSGGGPGGGRGAAARAFDPATVATVQGDIVEIERIERGRGAGVHLTLAAGSETLSVHLGPDFYVDAQPLTLVKGDRIEVKGSRVTMGGGPVVIAQEVRRGSDVLKLRDADGVPLWRRSRS